MQSIHTIVDEALTHAAYPPGIRRERAADYLTEAFDERDRLFDERLIDLLVGSDLAPHEDAVRLVANARAAAMQTEVETVKIRDIAEALDKATQHLVDVVAHMQTVLEQTG